MRRTGWRMVLLGTVAVCIISVGFAVMENAPKIEEFYKEGIDAYQDAERLEKIFPEGAKVEYELAIKLFERGGYGDNKSEFDDDATYKIAQSYDRLIQFAKSDDEKIDLMKKAEDKYTRIVMEYPVSPFNGPSDSRLIAIRKALGEMQKKQSKASKVMRN